MGAFISNGLGVFLAGGFNGTRASSTPAAVWTATRHLAFGTGGYVEVGDVADMTATGATWAFWVRAEESGGITSNDYPLVVKRVAGAEGYYIGRKTTSDETWDLSAIVDDDTVNRLRIDITDLPKRKWVHVVFVFDGVDTATVYVNGVSAGSDTDAALDPALIANSATLFFGSDADQQKFFLGQARDLAFWPSDQSANVAAIYNTGTLHDLSLLGTPPLYYWPCGMSGDDATANTGTIQALLGSADGTPKGTLSLPTADGPDDEPVWVADYAWIGGAAYATDVGDAAIGSGFSASVWTKPEVTGKKHIFSKSASDAATAAGWVLYRNASAQIGVRIKGGTGSRELHVTSDTTVSVETWYHVAFTWSGEHDEVPILYINGAAVATTTVAATLQSGDDVSTTAVIGMRRYAATYSTFADLTQHSRDYAIWAGTELSAAQVLSLYSSRAWIDVSLFSPAPSYYWCCAARGDVYHTDYALLEFMAGAHAVPISNLMQNIAPETLT